MTDNMEREFANRDRLVAYLREQFPTAAERDDHISVIVGGRAAAQTAVAKVNPAEYAKSRNFLTGAVTRLSPYIRYGVLSLAEIKNYILERVEKQEAIKLINELGCFRKCADAFSSQ